MKEQRSLGPTGNNKSFIPFQFSTFTPKNLPKTRCRKLVSNNLSTMIDFKYF